jgi:hypothetical protein
VIAFLLAALLPLPFPIEPGASWWVYREAYAERRGDVDVITEEETRFEARGTRRRVLVVQTGGADPAGTAPIDIGEDFVRLGPWTGEDPLPLPLAVGAARPADEEGNPGWVVEAEEEVTVPAGSWKALRCALRTWRSESVLWIAPGIGVVREIQGAPGQRPEIDRVLLRASTLLTGLGDPARAAP